MCPFAKVTENGSKDFLAFRHGVRGLKCKKNYTAGFFPKTLVRPRAGPLGPKWPKIEVFRTLRGNGSNDFVHLAYLDRSHQYLQLFYWHQVLENSSWPSRAPFRSKFWGLLGSKFFFSTFFKKKFFFSVFSIFFVLSWKLQKKIFFPLGGQVTRDLEFFTKKSKIEVFRTLRENASLDFAHLAYLDRSHQYLQLFYWPQVLENSR